jgi:hypothetical protein
MVGERKPGEGRGPEGDQRTDITTEIDLGQRRDKVFPFLENKCFPGSGQLVMAS